MNWQSAVAQAAPAIPQLKTKMKIGQIAILRIPPTPNPIMPITAKPSERKRLLRVKDAAIKGAANSMTSE